MKVARAASIHGVMIALCLTIHHRGDIQRKPLTGELLRWATARWGLGARVSRLATYRKPLEASPLQWAAVVSQCVRGGCRRYARGVVAPDEASSLSHVITQRERLGRQPRPLAPTVSADGREDGLPPVVGLRARIVRYLSPPPSPDFTLHIALASGVSSTVVGDYG